MSHLVQRQLKPQLQVYSGRGMTELLCYCYCHSYHRQQARRVSSFAYKEKGEAWVTPHPFERKD